MKRNIVLLLLTFLAVVLQLSVFSSWSLSFLSTAVSPQIFVVLAVYLLVGLGEDYVWYFTFFYFLFYDLINRPALPGVNMFLIILALLGVKLLRNRIFKKSVFFNLVFFVLFSSFYFVLIYHRFSVSLVLVQALDNLFMFVGIYPSLYLLSKFLKSGSASQLSLKL